MTRGRSGSTRVSGGAATPSKICASCGRRFEWRAKWARSWNEVRYCSDACRRRGVTADDRAAEERIVAALSHRPRGTAVDLDSLDAPDGSETEPGSASARRELMRRAARRLADREVVVWLQGGAPVDPSTARGPVGIRLV
ncbi:DUF2256 domain-containing protein [Herbiconiux sp. KACC 21604]|uniref:DUF2256 domain-containing protein n=1 Tax=unclassified Herbiconiux TaxID=2618217 RepID=UPI0014923622|nr:DUF2256 domain-containing protein [Herbiconiux sp. SALV-R1]QJU52669.1 DUF2256 domain-containing protein [Herbiconiux sp. SALV-R1]WPO87565.1 DUF2256 domain-containing protein [Herbiconiux sp. KACC 21604]